VWIDLTNPHWLRCYGRINSQRRGLIYCNMHDSMDWKNLIEFSISWWLCSSMISVCVRCRSSWRGASTNYPKTQAGIESPIIPVRHKCRLECACLKNRFRNEVYVLKVDLQSWYAKMCGRDDFVPFITVRSRLWFLVQVCMDHVCFVVVLVRYTGVRNVIISLLVIIRSVNGNMNVGNTLGWTSYSMLGVEYR